MNRRRLHRWWLLNAVWGCVLIAWEAVLLAIGLHGAWLLLPTVPVTVVQFIGWRKTRPVRPRPDYKLIAALEGELLDIDPAPVVATVEHRTNPHSSVVFLSTTHGIKPGWFELRAPDGATDVVRAHSVTACALHLTAALEHEFPAGSQVVATSAPG